MNSGSNDFFSDNCALFCARFPELSALLGFDSQFRPPLDILSRIPADYRLEDSASGHKTLIAGSQALHSRYDPLKEASRSVTEIDALSGGGAVVFCGLGLGYSAELYAASHPEADLIIIEPDIFLFMLFLQARDVRPLLSHKSLMLLVGVSPREAREFLSRTGHTETAQLAPASLTRPSQAWFDEFSVISARQREKDAINTNTLARFGGLWLSNMSRNLEKLADLPGVESCAGLFSGIPALILAAGPSLDRILPHLSELRRHCLIIAVDTALRAALRAGVQPDFTVLVDPQYWNFRHLDGQIAPQTILVTESAAWPAVFRFHTRSTFLCSSLFPLGKFLENYTGKRGALGAGGSVSTTAWDLARLLGCRTIIMAGLDLGFPGKRTHAAGSVFEERSHITADRLKPAETEGFLALYSAAPYPVPSTGGGTVLTDKRLILYAWWFESTLANHPEIRTQTLCPEGVRIPGIEAADLSEILTGNPVREKIDLILNTLLEPEALPPEQREALSKERRQRFERGLADLKTELERIRTVAQRGARLCQKALRQSVKGQTALSADISTELNKIDSLILESSAKEVAAMVFSAGVKPAGASGLKDTRPSGAMEASLDLYQRIVRAADQNLRALSRYPRNHAIKQK